MIDRKLDIVPQGLLSNGSLRLEALFLTWLCAISNNSDTLSFVFWICLQHRVLPLQLRPPRLVAVACFCPIRMRGQPCRPICELSLDLCRDLHTHQYHLDTLQIANTYKVSAYFESHLFDDFERLSSTPLTVPTVQHVLLLSLTRAIPKKHATAAGMLYCLPSKA